MRYAIDRWLEVFCILWHRLKKLTLNVIILVNIWVYPGTEAVMTEGVNLRKVAMIGCGFVGSASAFSLMNSGLFSEMVLIDANKEKAEGETMDISHGVPF